MPARRFFVACFAGLKSVIVELSQGDVMVDPANDLSGHVFILGVGAQRAGTSWLYNYLTSHPCVCMSEIKELHYFNALWSENHRLHAHKLFTSALKRLASGIDRTGSRMSPEVAAQGVRAMTDRIAMFDGGDKAYIDYFRSRVAPHHTHFGEITPAYSLLPVESFRHIRSLFPNIRVIFLMRDPVHRVVSALHIHAGPENPKTGEVFFAALRDPIMVERTRYDLTVSNLRAVFPPECLFFGFYETLFCDASIRALCEFLRLPFKPGEYGQFSNSSTGQPALLTSSQIDDGRSVFADTYAFCRREFGSAVPANWHG